jgi:hypothetical protein
MLGSATALLFLQASALPLPLELGATLVDVP